MFLIRGNFIRMTVLALATMTVASPAFAEPPAPKVAAAEVRPAQQRRAKGAQERPRENSEVQRVRGLVDAGRVLRVLGGVDSGGGNTMLTANLSPRDLREFVRDAHHELPLVMNRLEQTIAFVDFSSSDIQVAKYTRAIEGIKTRVFPAQGRDIFSIHKEASYTFQVQGACRERGGQEVDASVYGMPANKICLSQSRLLKKLTWGNAATQLSALLAHELSHKLGTTEDEAETIQFLILGMTQYQALNDFVELTDPAITALAGLENSLQNAADLLQNQEAGVNPELLFKSVEALYPNAAPIKSLIEYARHLGKFFETAKLMNLQSQLVTVSRDANKVFEIFTSGQEHRSVLRKKDFDKAVGLTFKTAALNGYFEKAADHPDTITFDKVFRGRDWVSVRDFASPQDSSAEKLVDIDEKVYRVFPGNKESLSRALQDCQETVEQLKEAVRKYEAPTRRR